MKIRFDIVSCSLTMLALATPSYARAPSSGVDVKEPPPSAAMPPEPSSSSAQPVGEASRPTGDVGAAASAGDRRREAREAFQRGLDLARDKRFAEAVAEFRNSERIKAHPITSYNVAFCEAALGLPASSFRDYVRALAPVGSASADTIPEGFVIGARRRKDEVALLVGHARVSLTSPDVFLRVDGRGVEGIVDTGRTVYLPTDDPATNQPVPASFDLWLDPGEHVFAAVSRTGGLLFEVRRVVGTGAVIDLAISTLPVRPTAPSVRPPTDVTPRLDHGGTAAAPDRTWAYVAFGTGAAALVTSGVFAALTLSDKAYLDEQGRCPNHACPPELFSREDRMQRYAAFATAGLVVGVVGGAAGTYLWLSGTGARSRERKTSTAVAPYIAIGRAGIAGRFW